MAQLTLITGGCRSGKSGYAQRLGQEAAAGGAKVTVLATGQALDEEMKLRIAHHKAHRPESFTTVEEPLDVADAARALYKSTDFLLVDCLTLWVANLLGAGRQSEDIVAQARGLGQVLKDAPYRTVVVTDEVGSSIVPDHPLARLYRDLLGWTNQHIAAVADEIVLMVVGYPMRVK